MVIQGHIFMLYTKEKNKNKANTILKDGIKPEVLQKACSSIKRIFSAVEVTQKTAHFKCYVACYITNKV